MLLARTPALGKNGSGWHQGGTIMSKGERARWMRRIKCMLHPLVVQEMAIVEASSTSWMALAVLKSGNDRRFRFQGGKLLDESVIGDARAA